MDVHVTREKTRVNNPKVKRYSDNMYTLYIISTIAYAYIVAHIFKSFIYLTKSVSPINASYPEWGGVQVRLAIESRRLGPLVLIAYK